MAQQNVTKLTYQLKKAEQEVEALKKKEKVKAIEFQTLQQSVSGRLKMQQQRINRLEQEVLEAKNARDVVTQELQKTLKQVIDMGKLDPESKASSLASTLERMEKEVEKLRKELETSKSAASDAEAKVCSLQTRLDLAEAEKAFAVRSMQESREVITKPLREKVCVVMGGASDDHGRASSSFLASHGARVGVIDKDAEKLKLLITELKAAGHVAEGFEDVNKVVQAFSMVAVDFVVVFGCDDFKARLPLQLLAEGARVVLVTSSVVELDPDWAKVKLIVVKTGKGDLCPLLEFLASNAANGIVSGTVIALE